MKSLAEGRASSEAQGGEKVSVACPPPFSSDCGLWLVLFCLKEIFLCSQAENIHTKRIDRKSERQPCKLLWSITPQKRATFCHLGSAV